jgi:hypothetical protein
MQFAAQGGGTGVSSSIVPMETRQASASSHRSVLDKQEAMTHAKIQGPYESINNPVTGSPTHHGTENMSRSESGGAIAQCSDPSPVGASRNQLYPTLPSQRSERKRKPGQELGGSTPKRSRNLEKTKNQTKSVGVIKGMINNVWEFVGSRRGGKKAAESSQEQTTSGDEESEEQVASMNAEEQDNEEEFHSCNEGEGN